MSVLLNQLNQEFKKYLRFLESGGYFLENSKKIVSSCLQLEDVKSLLKNPTEQEQKVFEICSLDSSDYSSSNKQAFGFNIEIENVEHIGIISIDSSVDEFSGCLLIHEIEIHSLQPVKLLEDKAKNFILQNPSLAYCQILVVNDLK